jgi:hypothetical protein
LQTLIGKPEFSKCDRQEQPRYKKDQMKNIGIDRSGILVDRQECCPNEQKNIKKNHY